MWRMLVFFLALGTGFAQQRVINFSSYQWGVKKSTSKVGPGPNLFSDSASNVWADSSGRLHLKITKGSGNKWNCAEVVLLQTLGYGTYRFYLDSPVDNLDKNVVLGLFTWSDVPAENNRELDIEFSRWGNAKSLIVWYTVQPYTLGYQLGFAEPALNPPQSIHSFTWSNPAPAPTVMFQSLKGTSPVPTSDNVIASKAFTVGVPHSLDENARMNLWLFQGNAPSNKREVEIIVNRFEFVPGL